MKSFEWALSLDRTTASVILLTDENRLIYLYDDEHERDFPFFGKQITVASFQDVGKY